MAAVETLASLFGSLMRAQPYIFKGTPYGVPRGYLCVKAQKIMGFMRSFQGIPIWQRLTLLPQGVSP
jgi:hypothetical protein